ncbi:MAG: hypothetical protein V4738_14355 [Pseudomonadota bacterium]
MKYIIKIFVVLFVTWPAVIVGYVVGAMLDGLDHGDELFRKHALSSAEKFFKKGDKP